VSKYKYLYTANMSSNSQQPASLVGGHAQYAKGYVEETIGNVTGSKEWQDSGKEDAQAGVDQMKVCLYFLKKCLTPDKQI
jgi:uncharacterized protein YjbJ (UPF0337 family)